MADRPATCRICGAELEGRDVYEGVCRTCREEEILSGGVRPRKPAAPRPRPAPAPTPQAPAIDEPPPSPDVPSIDMDADTKELVVLADGTSAPPEPPGAAIEAPPLDTPAAHPEAADSDTEAVPLVMDNGDEIEILDVDGGGAEPSSAAVAIRVDEQEDGDRDYALPITEVDMGLLAGTDGEHSAVTVPPDMLRFVPDDEAGPAAPPPIAPPSAKPEPEPAPAEEPPADEPPMPGLSIAADEPAAAPPPAQPSLRPAPTVTEPSAPRLELDAEFDARLRRLESRLAELSDRVAALARAQGSGGSGGGAAVKCLAAVGVLAILGAGAFALLKYVLHVL